ncbi:isochorismatase family protein [Streptomyces sp. NPDC048305]|uniref:isochorismatase family protein n=1 Tax=Streptomyces sp. NPDC048305 TaxID=3365532 RepID=UPI0037149E09
MCHRRGRRRGGARRQGSVLSVHDLQQHFLSAFPSGEQPLKGMLADTARLLEHARGMGVPVVYCTRIGGRSPEQRGLQLDFWGPGGADDPAVLAMPVGVAPEPGDTLLVRCKYSAFARTDLEGRLRAQGRGRLVIVGVYARIGVMMTACDAWVRDIQAFVLADATADFSREEHGTALRWSAGRCAVATITDPFLAVS